MDVPFRFDARFRLGIPSLDDEHEALLREFHELAASPERNVYSAAYSERFSRIGQLLAAHFEHEEALFRRAGLPTSYVAGHIEAHTQILEQFTELNQALIGETETDFAQAVAQIRDWLETHLLVWDRVLIDFLHPSAAR